MQMYSSCYPCVQWLGLHQIQMQTTVFAWELKYVSYFTCKAARNTPVLHHSIYYHTDTSIYYHTDTMLTSSLSLDEHVCTRWHLPGRPSATGPRSLNSTWVIKIALWHTGFLRCGLRDYRLPCSHGTTSNKAFGAKGQSLLMISVFLSLARDSLCSLVSWPAGNTCGKSVW